MPLTSPTVLVLASGRGERFAASGVPVLTSDRSCMPEVTNGAALLVNPDDVEAIRAQLERLIEDAPWRAGATDSGLVRAGALTWERCLDQTTEVYRSVA